MPGTGTPVSAFAESHPIYEAAGDAVELPPPRLLL